MDGPYKLTENSINSYVAETIGNYALGNTENNQFTVLYVGRSDNNLNQRLKDHLSEGYLEFKFSTATNVIAAYRKECKNYHDFKPRDNKIHPDKPDGLELLSCPVCNQ
jgi:hypothetical protein